MTIRPLVFSYYLEFFFFLFSFCFFVLLLLLVSSFFFWLYFNSQFQGLNIFTHMGQASKRQSPMLVLSELPCLLFCFHISKDSINLCQIITILICVLFIGAQVVQFPITSYVSLAKLKYLKTGSCLTQLWTHSRQPIVNHIQTERNNSLN